MTSKEFASEKKFIYVSKYYNKCQVRKDESPVAEYYQNPYNPNDRRIRIERKQEDFPQFIITRPSKLQPLQTGQLQSEKEGFAVDCSSNLQSNNNQKSNKTEPSTQDQDKNRGNEDLRAYITKLEEKVEFLTKQVRDLHERNKSLQNNFQQSRPTFYNGDNLFIFQQYQHIPSTQNQNLDHSLAMLQHADQFSANQDQYAITDKIKSQQVPKVLSSNEGNNQYQFLQQQQQNIIQYYNTNTSQQQIFNNSVQERIENHIPIPFKETSQDYQKILQTMGQSSQQQLLSHHPQILQPFNTNLIHQQQQQVPLKLYCGVQIVRNSELPKDQSLAIQLMGNVQQNLSSSRVPKNSQTSQQNQD
eukprot:403351241